MKRHEAGRLGAVPAVRSQWRLQGWPFAFTLSLVERLLMYLSPAWLEAPFHNEPRPLT